MKITTSHRICDLQERILGIGEDEAGNVIATAANDLVCVVSRTTGATKVDLCDKDYLSSVFVAGRPIRIVECGSETALNLPDHRRIVIPIARTDIFSYCYLPQSLTLHVLGLRDWLTCYLSDPAATRVHSLGELAEIPQYERIEASEEGVVICQYGLIIGPKEGEPVMFDPARFPYCRAAFLSEDTVIAAVENGMIHTIHTKRGLLDEIAAPRGSIYFLARYGKGAVLVWEDEHPNWEARKLYGARILGHEWDQVCFGHVHSGPFAVAQAEEAVYVGTLDSLIRWDVSRGAYETAPMPEGEPVVELFWSQSMQDLFIGCKYGGVYAVRQMNR
jgi:hypothetical protein